MAVISRNTKTSGGTTLADGNVAFAADVETDMAAIFLDHNGNITNANVATGAAIDPGKVDDASAVASQHDDTANPGVSGSENLPNSLRIELHQLRYKLWELGVGAITNLAATQSAWFDTPARGRNLLTDPQFIFLQDDAATWTPIYWMAVDTPTLSAATNALDLTKSGISIAAAGSTEGVSQTLSLSPLKKYIVGCTAVMSVAGTFHLQTTGAAAGSFTNLDLTTTSTTTLTQIAGIIQTDATPTNIVVKLVVESGGTAFVTDVFCYECSGNHISQNMGGGYTSVSTLNTPAAFAIGSWTTVKKTGPVDLAVSALASAEGMLAEVTGGVYLAKGGADG